MSKAINICVKMCSLVIQVRASFIRMMAKADVLEGCGVRVIVWRGLNV